MTKTPELEVRLEAMRAATTPDDLESAFQDAFQNKSGKVREWNRIVSVRTEAGRAMCETHPNGWFVPKFGPRRQLSVCGETYKIGKGGNSTGVRYSWTYAQHWAIETMTRHGLSQKAAHLVWGWWGEYPHRALRSVVQALAGELPDPQLNVLIKHQRSGGGSPIRYSVEENEKSDPRASQPCPCGGTLFDWGAGDSSGFMFVNWHCCVCPDVFTEYMTYQQLCAMRAPASRRQAA